MKNLNEPLICQCCSMPLVKDGDYGTNADGSVNEDYCVNCFSGGKYTQPNITKDEMVDQVTDIMMQTEQLPIERVRFDVDRRLRNLRRWQ